MLQTLKVDASCAVHCNALQLERPALAIGKSTFELSVEVFMAVLVDCVLGGD